MYPPGKDISWQHIAVSILIGACIALLSTVLDGLKQLLTEPGTHALSSGAGMFWYLVRLRA